MCRSIRSLFVTVFTLASLLVAAPALAVDILVTTGLDSLDEDGSCSLREAVIAANTDAAVDSCAAGSGADRVLVSRNGYYPLVIAGPGENASMTGDLDVVGDLQIVAVGPSSGRARIWQEDEDRALHVVRLESETSRLKLVDISLTDAYLSAEVPYSRCGIETDGGCVYVDPASEIEMVNSRVNSGRATERGVHFRLDLGERGRGPPRPCGARSAARGCVGGALLNAVHRASARSTWAGRCTPSAMAVAHGSASEPRPQMSGLPCRELPPLGAPLPRCV